jgi:tetratricopeptide (TPR) repeat protein
MRTRSIGTASLVLLLCFSASGRESNQDMPITSASQEALNLYLQSRTLLEMEKNQEAIPLFEQAVAKDSSFAFAYLALASASIKSQGISAYMKLLQKAIALQDQVSAPEKLCLQALDLTWQVKNHKAVARLQTVLQQYPNDKRIMLMIADNYFAFQQLPDSALVFAKRALAIDAAFIPTLNLLISIYQEMGDFPQAERAGLRLIELMPGEPGPLIKLANLYPSQHRNKDALLYYEKALGLQANNTDALVGIASTHLIMEQYDEARKGYEQLLSTAKTDRECTRYRNLIMMTYIEEGNLTKAVELKEKILTDIAASSDHIYIANNSWPLSVLYLEAKQWQKAKATHDDATRHYLLSAFTPEVKKLAELSQLGFTIELAIRQNDLQTAKNKIDQYMATAKECAVTGYIQYGHELKAMILLYDKKYDEAIDEFNLGEVKSAYIQYRLAQTFSAKGDTVKAKAHYLNVINSQNMDIYYFLFRKKAKAAAAQLD